MTNPIEILSIEPCETCGQVNLSINRYPEKWLVTCLYCDIAGLPHFNASGATAWDALQSWNQQAREARAAKP